MKEMQSLNKDHSVDSATGPMEHTLLNDYLFRALLQKNNLVLKGLICSLLHLSPKEVESVTITNPIELGRKIDAKTFILDIRVLLDKKRIINMEMQVINEGNWRERSMSYACRNFDQLLKGDDYSTIKPVIQIGILNFTLFKKYPEFYATNKVMNVKHSYVYSNKMCIKVLDLTKIKKATPEDKRYHIDDWARLLKAARWEELKMLAKKGECFREAAETVYMMSQDELIRDMCWAREDYERREREHKRLRRQKANLEKKLKEKEEAIKEKDIQLVNKEKEIEQLRSFINSK